MFVPRESSPILNRLTLPVFVTPRGRASWASRWGSRSLPGSCSATHYCDAPKMLRGARGSPARAERCTASTIGKGEITAFITLRHASLGTIFYRALRCEPSPPLRRALWHESRGPWLCEHGVPPSRDVRPHDAWPLPRGGERHASDVLMLSCGAPQLSLTYDFLRLGRLAWVRKIARAVRQSCSKLLTLPD